MVTSRFLRETGRRVLFSMNESEALLRQAASAINPKGYDKAFWIQHWLGAYLFLGATANLIHFASTGEPLPLGRYTPISKTKDGPIPFGYNTTFMSPTIPLTGKGSTEIMLDLVGQLDTAFRILNPVSFITARESVPVRALENQLQAEDFYNMPIDTVGPGGVASRTTHLIQDLFAPIGVGQAGANIMGEQWPGAQPFISMGEEKLGTAGQLVQAGGANLRGESIDDHLRRTVPGYDSYPAQYQKTLKAALIKQVYGEKTRFEAEARQEKIWELWPPTEEQRKKFEAKMDLQFGGKGGSPGVSGPLDPIYYRGR
jgi:hypothetical protein